MSVERTKNIVDPYIKDHNPKALAEDAIFILMATGEEVIGRENIGLTLQYFYQQAFEAFFEPNNLRLWEALKRTITEFLTRVWRSGALFGETDDKAFYVRIDEGLNPPSTRALGRLYIEIGVAPARPAEFIIVRIGLWRGGAELTEA